MIVTHNYEQVEQYATRRIRMHDGKIVEDEVITPTTCEEPYQPKEFKNITFFNRLRLGIRNTFNIPIKFILIFTVFALICSAVLSAYTTMAHSDDVNQALGYSYFFQDISGERIIIQKADRSGITEEDFAALEALEGVDYIVRNDVSADTYISANNDICWLYSRPTDISNFRGEVTYGRMPENDEEIIVSLYDSSYYANEGLPELLDKQVYLNDNYTGNRITEDPVTVVGVQVFKYDDTYYMGDGAFYLSSGLMETLQTNTMRYYSTVTSTFRGQTTSSDIWNTYGQVIPSKKVPQGKVMISEDNIYNCPDMKCAGLKFRVNVKNLYTEKVLNLKVKGTYNKKNFKSKTGYKDYQYYNGAYFVNYKDYNSLFTGDSYQSSVYIKDAKQASEMVETLKAMGYTPLHIQSHLVSWSGGFDVIGEMFITIVYCILGFALFFIAYFIIQLIYRSRNVYYSTIRILGANKRVAKSLLSIELFNVANLSFLAILGVIELTRRNYIQIAYVQELITYLKPNDYVVVYGIIMVICYLITQKYSKKLFEKTAMDTYRQGV